MTKTNQLQNKDDFKLAIVIRIEGRNSRGIVMKIIGIVVTLIAIGLKLATLFMEMAP